MKPLRTFLLLTAFAALAVAQNYNADVLALNPLGYWPLTTNNGDARVLMERPWKFSTGTFVTPNAPPNGNGSAAFTGGTQVFTLTGPQSASFNFSITSKFTAMAWVKTTGQALAVMPVMAKVDPDTSTGWGLLVDNGGNNGVNTSLTAGSGRVAFGFFAQGSAILTIESAVAINDGNWHLLAGSSDGTGQVSGLHIYIDGNPTFTTALASTGPGSPLNNAVFTIGNAQNGGIPFEGNIAGAAVFNAALTPAEINQLGEDNPFAEIEFSRSSPLAVVGTPLYISRTILGERYRSP